MIRCQLVEAMDTYFFIDKSKQIIGKEIVQMKIVKIISQSSFNSCWVNLGLKNMSLR